MLDSLKMLSCDKILISLSESSLYVHDQVINN